ncbi:isochorismatase family protein [Streptomyces sp. NBC_01754]|uniref:isochorismatase family protein n=1 Tax=Streptomyces sp. NBC_01754 TaxID=2975930 RepID=UPI002DDB4253|nr:isochorismatase family protein [Streptomyces sp. NBC_01754]WSC91833.1 isochorismatase family protein [Streptomyces sp. NBC_01754]
MTTGIPPSPHTGPGLRAADVREDYAAAGFSGTLPLGKRPALVVVDAARAYTEPDSPLYAAVEDAVAAMRQVLAVAREAGIPVFFTEVRFRPGGADGGVFHRKVPALRCFEEGNPLGDPIAGLSAAHPGEVTYVKRAPSAFSGTPLASALTAAGADSVAIVGLSTSGCVRATAVDAMSCGFVPVVIQDAVGDRHVGPHEAALFDIRAKIGEVVTLDRARDWLTGLERP